MFEREFSLEERNNLLKDSIIILVMFAFAFVVNTGIRISGLYMDDLYMWSCYGEQSFVEYVFPVGSTRFRPVYWFIAWLELGIIGNNITWIVPFNIIFAGIISAFLYLFAKQLSASRTVGLIAGIMFLCSRFSYYNISQLLGLMEAVCLLFLLIIVYNLYSCLTEKEHSVRFVIAVIFYFLICFTHERYMAILPMFFYVLFIKNLLAEILYILGINAGPEHLNGITWADTNMIIKLFVGGAALALLIIIIIYIRNQITLFMHQKILSFAAHISLLLLGTMAGCIVASAVTIRVEMRWVYAPYMLALLWLAHIYGTIKKEKDVDFTKKILSMDIDIKEYLPFILVLIWAVLMLPVEIYGHLKYGNIYLFPDQKRYNALADETYGKYGSKVFGKKIYIIGNHYEMSDFTAKTFFKVFDPKRKAEGTSVEFVESYRDFGQVTSNMLVIEEDVASNTFVDVTDMMRSVKCEAVRGYYDDGWLDEEAELNIMAGRTGIIKLEFMYPGELEGYENISMTMDNSVRLDFKLENNISYHEFEVKPYEIINLKIKNNFYMKAAEEKRGETNLSLLVNIESN